MKVIVRNGIRDLIEFFRLGSIRKKHFKRAPAEIYPMPRIHQISAQLHPDKMHLKIDSTFDETEFSRTYRMRPADESPLPVFKSGQYVSLKMKIGESNVTRPYSISSKPADAQKNGYFDITIQRKDDGFVTSHIFQTWKSGTDVTATGPHGQFLYEPIRDGKKIACVAGGCGVTPFKALIADILNRSTETSVVLLYGITNPGSIIFKDYFEELAKTHPDRFSMTLINSGDPKTWAGEIGLIDAEKIRRLIPDAEERTFFLCGPLSMYQYLTEQLVDFGLKPGKIRFEAPGDAIDPADMPEFPAERKEEVVKILIRDADASVSINAKVGETILSAIEQAGLSLPSECRSGECGYCRSRLDSGEVFVLPNHDGRRLADRKFGYIHPCASYPLTDLEMALPKDPLGQISENKEGE